MLGAESRTLLAGMYLALVVCPSFAAAQEFEVASVHPASREGGSIVKRGGPGTDDPTRLSFENYPLAGIIGQAYNLPSYRLKYPSWMMAERYTVVAKVPAGASKQEVCLMLQHMLADRFALRVHHESEQRRVLALTVGKTGPKFKESSASPSAPDQAPAARPGGPLERDAQGYPIVRGNGSSVAGNMGRINALRKSMAMLAAQLSAYIDETVVDETGLQGEYDYTISWNTAIKDSGAADSGEVGVSLARAVEEQLGLRLQAKKLTIDVMIVDAANKVPKEN